MKILHLAYRDTSGVPGRWAAAHRGAGHDTRLLVELTHPFSYGADEIVLRWSPGSGSADERADRISEHLEWADAIMAYDHPYYLDAAIASGKPVLFRALGQSSRFLHDTIRILLEHPSVRRATAGTVDLARMLDVDLAGAPYPLLDRVPVSDRLRLCHSPSDRDAKGTSRVLAAAEATGWQVVLVENASNAAVLAEKASCALVVDTCGPGTLPDGYGVNAVEAMALGLPVVSSATEATAEMLRQIGSPVVLVDDEEQLRKALRILKEPGLREALGNDGREFVSVFHSPELRASEDAAALELVAA